MHTEQVRRVFSSPQPASSQKPAGLSTCSSFVLLCMTHAVAGFSSGHAAALGAPPARPTASGWHQHRPDAHHTASRQHTAAGACWLEQCGAAAVRQGASQVGRRSVCECASASHTRALFKLPQNCHTHSMCADPLCSTCCAEPLLQRPSLCPPPARPGPGSSSSKQQWWWCLAAAAPRQQQDTPQQCEAVGESGRQQQHVMDARQRN